MRDDTSKPDAAAGQPAKKPYRTPRLTTHGDLRKLALGTGGKRADGKGVPASKL